MTVLRTGSSGDERGLRCPPADKALLLPLVSRVGREAP